MAKNLGAWMKIFTKFVLMCCLSSLRLILQEYLKKQSKKPLKTTEKAVAVAGTNILPQNPKSGDISPPPPLRKCRKYTGVHAWVYQQLILSQCL